MEYFDIAFLKSAASQNDWPISDLPEIVLAGRSNVGKSSFINALCNRKNMARVGKTPGKTRLLNFFEVNQQLILVDVPGYGFANRSISEINQFEKMMTDYFEHRTNLKALFLLVDYRHKPTKDDVMMIEFARAQGIHTIVIATKADKVKASQKEKLKKLICETLNVKSIIPFSSLSKIGQDTVWETIENIKAY